ncbi:CapA family protein [Neobacillus jeddahensis]|uniref:CapA family protein n=1 Tax=Neobacillus jeddahensis TaxID=1461580 RepID=UPI000591764B|nr:CapA family protein [Neobacillus jeddahensis]
MKKKAVIPSLFIIVVSIAATIFLFIHQIRVSKQNDKFYSPKEHMMRAVQQESRELTEKVTIGAIGDILIHSPVYQDAYNGANYDFSPMFENVKPLLEKPDVLTANQESMLGGLELGLSGYPMFNSPYEVADALKAAGVDIVSTANNHTLDRGEKGIRSESTYLDGIGLPHVGSFTDEKDRQTLRIMEKNGIKIAFLAYTYGTNGIPVPKGKDFLVNLIDREKMKNEIHRAKTKADVVVMSIHWGNEYQRIPTNDQKDLAKYLANEGVDIIFGSHPHVLQPMDWINTSTGEKSFVIYSLGNFISGQYGDYKDIGGLVMIDITKHIDENGSTIELSNPQFSPTFVTSQKYQQFRVVPLENAGAYGLATPAEKYKEIMTHITKWIH